MRHPQRTVLAVLAAAQTGKPCEAIASEHGVSQRTVSRWFAEYRDRTRPDLWFRFSGLKRLPGIEAQLVEWIDLMEAKDTLKGLPASSSATLKWKGFEVHCRWTNWREVDAQKVHALEVARIRIPEKLRGREWLYCCWRR